MIINKRIYGERVDAVSPGWEFIGAGNNGIVYSISKDKVIKIFREDITCDREGDILLRVHGNRYFPNLVEIGENYIVREKVDGECLKDIIKRDGLSDKIAEKVVELLNEFQRLGFTRIDVRLKDIYVDNEENIKLIDPKGYFTRRMNYPRHLCKGLKSHGGLYSFLKALYENNPELYSVSMTNIYSTNRSETAKKLYKKQKLKKGKITAYGIGGGVITGVDLPIIEELDEDINFIDITEIESLL
ncbi:protein kinase [Oceanirhabdus seepicola]|uniref:Protein kinase n=1 Tax=Oceanirhabdus seepicola TaxID=2828781 RepID=A0A9J6NVV6_9CLOT|nr:protein kinase [Oceanirhabdus seepicola]MCM1988395.1 protein kinase [Oceanirhabdus seepicola]